MNDIVKVKYEWSYTPRTAIKNILKIDSEYGEIIFRNGIVSVEIETSNCKWNESLKLDLKVRSIAGSASLIEHKEIVLDGPCRSDTKKDGAKHYILNVHNCIIRTSSESVELVAYDQNGNEISNPRKTIEKKIFTLALLFEKYRTDNFFKQMYNSYQQSITDSKNELIHLYEIRETICLIFNGKENSIKALNISKSQWDILGILANTEPLLEGRHRGKVMPGMKRQANTQELTDARQCALEMIEKYLNYLEQKN